MTAPSDEALIAQVPRGDTAAFEALVRQYQAPALNLAYRVLGDAAEAEGGSGSFSARISQRRAV